MAAKRIKRKKPAARSPQSRRKGKRAQGVKRGKARRPSKNAQKRRAQPVKRPPAKKRKAPVKKAAPRRPSKKRAPARGIDATKKRGALLTTREAERIARVDKLVSQLRGTPRSNREKRHALAMEIAKLESRGPVAGRPGRHTRGVRDKRGPGRRDIVLVIPEVKQRKRGDYKLGRRSFDLPDVGRARKIGRTVKYQSGGWWERYEKAQAEHWVAKSGKQVPKVELRSRTIYERIRDQLLAFPPAMRERLVLRIRSNVLAGTLDQSNQPYGKQGLSVKVATDDELALASIPGLLYAAGVRATPNSPGESTGEIEVDWFLEDEP